MNRRELNRRDFTQIAAIGAAALLAGATGNTQAQGAPVEGQQYVKLSQPLAKSPGGKIEVVEFFWYGCPHCSAFEPFFDAWQKRQPADVQVRRAPVAFSPMHELHARIFYTLEAMGLIDTMHRKVFSTLQVERKRLDKEDDVMAFVKAQGIDAAQFSEMFKSFSVQTKVKQGKQLSEAYRIDGVPALGIAGRWYTAGSLAGGHQQALQVADYLIQQARRG
jgi:protein dithiol oxidoreductase (disulfide-forming)